VAGPKVVEFNCRFGDPETQAVLPLLKSDLADIMMGVVDGDLSVVDDLHWDSGAAICVVLSSKGYPGKAETGKRIFGLRNYSDRRGFLFHSGTTKEGRNWLSAGGRVVGVTTVGNDLHSAINTAYDIVDKIKFDGMYFRSDIGYKANNRLKVGKI
jgi:phosphoribosylamine--glycine ligase